MLLFVYLQVWFICCLVKELNCNFTPDFTPVFKCPVEGSVALISAFPHVFAPHLKLSFLTVKDSWTTGTLHNFNQMQPL